MWLSGAAASPRKSLRNGRKIREKVSETGSKKPPAAQLRGSNRGRWSPSKRREPVPTDAVGKVGPTWQRPKMNSDQLKGNWKQLVGKAKEKWGRLTDDDWKIVEGKRDQLVGKLQERYGIAREEAERQVAEFERTQERV